MSDTEHSFHFDEAKVREVVQVPCSYLSSGAKLVFIDLLSHAKHKYCHRSQRKIAEDVGMSERQVRSHIKKLTTLNIIRITKVNANRPSGLVGTNTYDLLAVLTEYTKRKEDTK